MNLNLTRGGKLTIGLVVAIMAMAPSVRANVYATNIKLNGGTANLVSEPGQTVDISYLLNEPALLGVSMQIMAGTNAVRTVALPLGATNKGLTTVTWTNDLPPGNYWVSITAASSGYTNWTQITTDAAPGAGTTYVYDGQGIAVDRNPNSIYYGRIFVANSAPNPVQDPTPGDMMGILKFNADTSGADEGIASTDLDGHTWSGTDQNPVSPWKIAVSDDDFVYVDDMVNSGEVYRWDPTISSNSLLYVLRVDNQPAGAHLSGPAILNTGTNVQIWMADNFTNKGILRWNLNSSGVCNSNDLGTKVIALSNLLSLSPTTVALDKFRNIYTCQSISTETNPAPRVFRFPAYDPSTNNNLPQVTPDWAVGSGDDTYGSASGLAADPTGTYLAVAFQGVNLEGSFTNGNLKILYATNGSLVTNIDLGIDIDNLGDAKHQDTDCAWDAVGNVYYIDTWLGNWRAVSPPGTNQSTTVAVPIIQVSPSRPSITSIQSAGDKLLINFTASTSDYAESFAVAGATNATGPYAIIPAISIVQISPGNFRATVAASPTTQFYRIARLEAPPPIITNMNVSGSNVRITFKAGSMDFASAFSVVGASAPNGTYAPLAGGSVQQIDVGVFEASVSTRGAVQFYRIAR